MTIEVDVLGKYKMAYGLEVEISYRCPHCKEDVNETICFSNDIQNCVVDLSDHECPECGECNDLDVDLY